jgi:hypothetical protein
MILPDWTFDVDVDTWRSIRNLEKFYNTTHTYETIIINGVCPLYFHVPQSLVKFTKLADTASQGDSINFPNPQPDPWWIPRWLLLGMMGIRHPRATGKVYRNRSAGRKEGKKTNEFVGNKKRGRKTMTKNPKVKPLCFVEQEMPPTAPHLPSKSRSVAPSARGSKQTTLCQGGDVNPLQSRKKLRISVKTWFCIPWHTENGLKPSISTCSLPIWSESTPCQASCDNLTPQNCRIHLKRRLIH